MIHTHALRVFTMRLRLLTVAVAASAFALGFSDAAASTSDAGPSTSAARLKSRPPSETMLPLGVSEARAMRTATSTASDADDAMAALDVEGWSSDEVRAITPDVFKLALNASRCAISTGAVKAPSSLTIIDYSKPSVEPRLWVLDLNTREVLYEELVSHGQGSGGNLATKFSNVPDSHQTSIGLFVTDTTYVGRNGYSLRLEGLDEGFNDRARERAIVMHGAPYVNSGITKALGRLGRSHGCPAVRDAIARELIDRVKGGNLVFSYYPDAEWLEHSKYLGSCGQ